MIILPIIAMLCAPALWMVLGRPRYLRPVNKGTASDNTISVIIPARNEENNIQQLLRTLQAQELRPLEIIVVNDQSSDGTAKVSRQLGATVIDAPPLPAGWNGKPWACQQGAEHAVGDWLSFLDADTLLEKNAFRSLQHLSQDTSTVYSICPYHRTVRLYEQLSAFFNVLMLAGSNAFGMKDLDNPALFGQCLLISRQHYNQADGHRTVKDKVLENFHLSARLNELGIRRQCFMGKNTISMRMFPNGFNELWRSWQKGFSAGAAHTEPKALFWSSVWISGLMFTLVSTPLALTTYSNTSYLVLTSIAYFLGVIQTIYAFRLAGNFSFVNALLFPIALLFYQLLFLASCVKQKCGTQTKWKGRNVN